MSMIDMKDYNAASRRYWWAMTLLGAAAFAYSVFQVAQHDARFIVQVMAGTAVAAIVGLFPVRIPGAKASIAGAEIFIFLVMLLYGPSAAVIAAATEGFVASWRTSKRWTSRLGTPAMASIAMLACASGFQIARDQSGHLGVAALLTLLFAFSAFYFVASTILTSIVFALKTRAPITPVRWLREFSWIGLAYLTGASIAGLLFASFQQFGLAVLLVSVPVIAMFLSTLHSYFQRKESDQRHVEELKESESRFHSAFTHAAIGMALVSTEGRFMQANKAFCDMLGRSLPELLASQLSSLVNPDDLGALALKFRI